MLAPVVPAEHSSPAAVSQSRGPLQYAPVIAPLKSESTTTRKAGGLDFTAIGGKRQGREVPQSLKTTRWNRGFSCEAPGLENPIKADEFLIYTACLNNIPIKGWRHKCCRKKTPRNRNVFLTTTI
jgi:hypothetical protein